MTYDKHECDWMCERLAAYLEGDLAPEEREAADAHLASCASCTAVLAELRVIASRRPSFPRSPPRATCGPASNRAFGTRVTRSALRRPGAPRGVRGRSRSPPPHSSRSPLATTYSSRFGRPLHPPSPRASRRLRPRRAMIPPTRRRSRSRRQRPCRRAAVRSCRTRPRRRTSASPTSTIARSRSSIASCARGVRSSTRKPSR